VHLAAGRAPAQPQRSNHVSAGLLRVRTSMRCHHPGVQ
jgi:hypothetical protein